MAARDGMLTIIQELRLLTETAENDETVDGVAYWTDEQLQSILDRSRTDYIQLVIRPISRLIAGGTYEYVTYPFPAGIEWVETGDTDNVFIVQDTQGNIQNYAADYTVDFDAKIITFAVSTGGDSFYFTFRSYDINKAAADVWGKKLSLRTRLVNWKTDNHTIYEDQEYQHCLERYVFFSGLNGMRTGRMVRTDERANLWRTSGLTIV